MTEEAEVHDLSRVDAFMKARRRSMMMHAMWKPALAGAAGAALVIAAVAVAQPRFITREVEVPKIVLRDVPFENFVPHDVPFDVPVPRIVTPPVAANPPKTDAPKTPEERTFVARPEYESAQFKGKLIEDKDGQIRFDTGAVFVPLKFDPESGREVQNYDAEYVTRPFWGDYAFCNAIPAVKNRFQCLAIHHDVIVDLSTTYRPKKPTALHERREAPIRQIPIIAKQGRTT